MDWQSFLTSSSGQTADKSPVLPTRRGEDWRYVSLKWLENWNFKSALKTDIQILPAAAGFHEILFADGYLISELPTGLNVEVIRRDETPSATFQDWFSSFQAQKENIGAASDLFEELNDLRFQEGLFLDIPADSMPDLPVMLRWISTSNLGTRYPRIWVRVGERSKLILSEVFESSSNVEALSLPVMDVEIKRNANFEFTRVVKGAVENAQIGRTRILQDQGSNLESLSLAMGSRLVRHNLDVYMCEEGASAKLNGLAYTGGSQVVDHHTRVDFVVGNCQSTQLYKSILAGASRAVFNGQVVIRQNAQKSNSDQLNQNLLLSSKAEVDSKPQLEIFADDVKATHGSTIGQMDEEEVFYFLSRAIPRETAESMIRRGFTQDLLMQVSNPSVRDWVLGLQSEADQRLI